MKICAEFRQKALCDAVVDTSTRRGAHCWRGWARAVAAITTPVAPAISVPKFAGMTCLTLLLSLGGCASIGPATVPRDRADYIRAVGDSWKEQTLLNIVRMRYGDAPNFIEVSSIISSYASRVSSRQVRSSVRISRLRTHSI
jgi:hypothetical protein